MAKLADTSRYGVLTAQNAKRRAILQDGMSRSASMRNFMSANINKNVAVQVKTTEMQLRSNAQAAANLRISKLTAAQNKVDKSA